MDMIAPPDVAVWRAHTRVQAAQILQVSVKQVDAAIRRGELDVARIGRHIRISDSELRRFAKQAPAAAAAA